MFKLLCWIFIAIAIPLSAEKNLSFTSLKGLDGQLEKEAAIQLIKRQLASFHQQEVEIRGFLYKNAAQNWVLASEPNLKVCCMGTPSKISQQILLFGDAQTASAGAITVRGIFLVDPIWDKEGILVQLYRLNDVKIISQTTWPSSSLALAGTGISSICFLYFLSRKKLSTKEAKSSDAEEGKG